MVFLDNACGMKGGGEGQEQARRPLREFFIVQEQSSMPFDRSEASGRSRR